MTARDQFGGIFGLAFTLVVALAIAAAIPLSADSTVIMLALAGGVMAVGIITFSAGAVAETSFEVVSARSIGRGFAYIGLLFSCAPAIAVTTRLPISELAFIAAVFFGAVESLTSTRRSSLASALSIFVVGAALIAAGGLIASTGYHGPGGSAKAALWAAFRIVLPALALALTFRTRRDATLALQLWIVSIAVSSTVGVFELVSGRAVFGIELDHGRALGLTLHPNDLGSIAGIATAAVWILVLRSRGVARAGWCCAAIALLGGIFVSGSAGGMIAAIIALGTWLVLDRTRGKATLMVGAAVLAFAVVALFAPFATSSAQRLSGIVTGTTPVEANTALIRIEDYRFGYSSVSEDPFVGVGANSRAAITPQGTRVQNVFLQPWLEMGLLGFFGAVILLSAVSASMISTFRTSRDTAFAPISVALATILLSFLFIANEQLVYTKMIWWVPIGLIFGAGAVVGVRER